MTLIEMVRATRKNGHRYCAVDKNGEAYSYLEKPEFEECCFDNCDVDIELIGNYKLTCDWKDSLIDVTKLRGMK